MIPRRRGSAVLALGCVALPLFAASAVAAPGPGATGTREPVAGLLDAARTAGRRYAPVTRSEGRRAGSTSQGGAGPVFAPGGLWARAEAAALIGSQRVNQDLGFSRNIFQTVSAVADDVGFGEHYGARGTLFVNPYLGVEAGYTRTTTMFEIRVEDEEAGLVLFDEGLVQESNEFTAAAVAQVALAAVTPYLSLGYGWRESEVEGDAPFRTGALVFGAGIKVPFPLFPAAVAFDYRFVRYGGVDAPLDLVEGGTDGASVSALTLGILFRFGERD